jgi:hypothetical protein
MDFRLPVPKWPLLIVTAGAMILSAGAQQAGQPIVFSSPPDSGAPSVAPPSAPASPQFSSLPDTSQAPSSFFNFNVPDDSPPPPPVSAAGRQPMKNTLAERKNWTQMTPEEMFGVAPADKNDAAEPPDSLTPLERLFDQEKQPPRAAFTNAGQNDRANSPWDFPRDRNSAGLFGSKRENADNPGQNPGRLPGGWWNNDAAAKQNGTVSWDSFSAPAPQTTEKPNLEQLAAMDRFRQLLAPSPAPAADSKLFSAPVVPIDPNFSRPDFVPNPAGASFTPLISGIGLPVGLTPLPGIVTPISPPVVIPSWTPQPAPWLLQGPQAFTIPQRKF